VSNDLVFTSTFEGWVYAFAVGDGKLVWQKRMRAAINSCPAVVDDLVLFGAGIRLTKGATPEIVAFGLP
jgi:outer membrane protein assembly factor BamB